MVKTQATNYVANLKSTSQNQEFHQMIDVLKHSPLHFALSHIPTMHKAVLVEFWSSARVTSDGRQIKANVLNQQIIIDERLMTRALHLPAYKTYDANPRDEELKSMLARIGYLGDTTRLGSITRGKMSPTWSYLFDIIIRCLSAKIGGWDQAPQLVLQIAYGLIRNRKLNYGALLFQELCSKIGSDTLLYPRFISMILQKKLGTSYPTQGELLDATYINKRIYKQLTSKYAETEHQGERPITSGMRSVLSTPSLPPTSSKDTTKRKEPSSSRTQVSPPFKRSKSSKSTKPTSAHAQSAVAAKRDTILLAHSSQKGVAIEKSSKSLEHSTKPRTKHLHSSSKKNVKESQRAPTLPASSSQKDVAVEKSHTPMTYIKSNPQSSLVPSQKETVVIRENPSLLASSQQDVNIEKGHEPTIISEHSAQIYQKDITLHTHTESHTHDAISMETEQGIGDESIAEVLYFLKYQRRPDQQFDSPIQPEVVTSAEVSSPHVTFTVSPVVRPSSDVLTFATTPAVEVASHASTQEPTAGGSPKSAHVQHDAPLGHSLDVILSSSDVSTPGSDDTHQGFTKDPLPGGPRLPEQTANISAQASIPASHSDYDTPYEHDAGFEVYHSEDPKYTGIAARITAELAAEVGADEEEKDNEDPDLWMSNNLSISFSEAKRMVREEYLSTLASSSSYSGLNDIAEEINNKYKASLKHNYLLISGLAAEVETMKEWQKEERIARSKRDLAATIRDSMLKLKLTTLEQQMSDVLSIVQNLQTLLQQQVSRDTTPATTPPVTELELRCEGCSDDEELVVQHHVETSHISQ